MHTETPKHGQIQGTITNPKSNVYRNLFKVLRIDYIWHNTNFFTNITLHAISSTTIKHYLNLIIDLIPEPNKQQASYYLHASNTTFMHVQRITKT
jgi:hypothetical protein